MTSTQNLRPAVAFAIVMIMLLIPTARIAVIISQTDYQDAAAAQSVYTVKIGTERGTFYDRNMLPITNCDVRYVGTAAYYSDPAALSSAIYETAMEPTAALEAARLGKPFIFNALKEYYADGILSFPVFVRYSGYAAHLIGYPASSEESGYTGLEAAFSDVLDKYSGEITVSYTVDAKAHNLAGFSPEITDTTYKASGGIVLTLDRRLQDFAQQQLEGVSGAVVVLSSDGDILAAASSPSFDQNDIAASLDDQDSPFVNRVLSAYNVGSVFKTVVTTAALELGIPVSRTYECKGQIDINGVVIRCSRRSGHGVLDMKGALINSCNPYFIDLALEIGAEKLLETARLMGFGQSIELADGVASSAGNLPTEEDLIPPAAIGNLAIGQGTLLATPLQIAAAVNCVATGGIYVTPRLVLGERDENGMFIRYDDDGGERMHRAMSERSASLLLENMAAVFTDGSVSEYQPDSFPAAGKTSTAQTGIIAQDGHSVLQAWIGGVFPAVNPEYTVVVFVEDGTSGSASCGPIFKSVCDFIADTLM